MTRTRLIAVRIAGAIAGLVLSMLIATPTAHADVLADIRGTVTRDRVNAGCPEMKYNQTLQDLAFAQGQFIPDPPDRINGLRNAYGGALKEFIGVGDPMAAALTDAYKKGAGPTLSDCSFTEYGVSFVRYEPTETDWVGLIFGKPSVTTPPSGPDAPGGQGQEQKQAPPVKCGPNDEQTEVPAGQQCTPKAAVQCPPGGPQQSVPAGQKCPPPTNAVRVTFDRGFGTWGVNVKNNAGIGGSCTYTATSQSGLPGRDEAFDIAPNGTHSFDVLAPVGKYDVVTSCTGTYDGQQVEFGRDVQTVP